MTILEDSLVSSERLTPVQLLKQVRKMKLHTPSESVAMIREDRDSS